MVIGLLRLSGYRPGNYSLILQALWQYGLFGNYWDNSIYLGSPIESRVDPVIDFNWEAGSVARWSPDFVSVRWGRTGLSSSCSFPSKVDWFH